MKLFRKSESLIDNYRGDVDYADFANLAATYKAAPKNDLKKEPYFEKLDGLKRFPVRILDEAAKQLKSLNHYIVKPDKRLELARAFAGYIYPVIAMWHNKYQEQESSTPESNERKAALIASVDAVDQLTIAYKHVFRDLFDVSSSGYRRNRTELQEVGFRILELIRLEQRLRALRYQRLPKSAWQNANQVIFAFLHHDNDIDQAYKMLGTLGYEKKSDVIKQSKGHTNTIHNLYCSIQLFGLLDLNTWPVKSFHVPDMYLQYLGESAIIFQADDAQPLIGGTLLTYINNDHPPLFKRRNKMPGPCVLLNYANLYNALVKDHEELAKMEFIKRFDAGKLSKPLLDLDTEERIPVLEMMLLSLKLRERQQKRHAVFAEEKLRVYFGCRDVNKLITDLVDPDIKRVMDEREFVDTLAQQSAMVADDDKKHMNSSWRMMNFSAGGMLIGTQESAFNSPIQIGQMVAVSPADDVKKQTVGYVSRIVRPHDNQIEVAITRIANHVEASVIQTNEEIEKNVGHASLLMNNGDGKWQIALHEKTEFVPGMPLKLTRGDGSKLPVRLGEVWLKKRDFTVYELRSPGLKI